MKKFIVFAVVLALLVPAAAFAATEFSLGGFVKLDTMWDSDCGVGKNINVAPARNNNADFKHGRLKFTAQGSRFNFTIKGPKLWGADISGFMEMDFDSNEAPIANSSFTSSNSYTPRLRHAMFRFNWPTSELLFGLYWSMFCEYYAESAEDGPLQMTGTPTHRLGQIRFTQKFMQDWTVAFLVGDASQARTWSSTASSYGNQPSVGAATPAINNGQSAESPQIQGKISYAHDFWGKAAYYGKPTPFTVQVVGGWQRNVLRAGSFAGSAFSEGNGAGGTINVENQNLNPWLFMGSLFIPVISTSSANLAGTASILTQWWIGQGVEAFGFSGVASNKYKLIEDLGDGHYWGHGELLNKFGGFVEGQYYFNNQWFLNVLYAFSKAYNVSHATVGHDVYAFTSMSEASTIQQINATLWYRPIQAIKFGMQYSYASANYFQPFTTPTGSQSRTNFGNDHRVEFVGFFYF